MVRLSWRLLAVAAIALLGVVATPFSASAQPACGARTDVLARLSERFGEKPVALGVTSDGRLLEVVARDDGVTWSILLTTIIELPDGRELRRSCLFAAGEGWRWVAPAVAEDPET